jgi:hypothetical protein
MSQSTARELSVRAPATPSASLFLDRTMPWWPKRGADIVWKTTPVGTLATPRGFLGAALAGHKVYTFGGQTPESQGALDTVESFDIESDQSVALPNLHLPHARSSAAVVKVASGSVYVCGGGDAHNGQAATCYECIPPGGPWHAKADMPQTAVCVAGAADSDGRVYVIGGLQGVTPSKAVQRFDPAVGTWSQVQALHAARFAAAAAAAGGKIYVFGGLDHKGYVESVEEYDPATDKWTVLTQPMMTPRYDLAAVTGSNGRIYVIGGMRQCSGVDLVEEFNPTTKSWKQMTPMPTPRYGVGVAATTDGRIFVLGGWRKISGTYLATGVIEEGTLPT